MSLTSRDNVLGILGFGEVGKTLRSHLLGLPSSRLELHIYDPLIGASPNESDSRTKLHSGLGPWIGEVGLILSVVPGSEAVSAAASAGPHMKAGQLYVDLSTTAPEDALRARDVLGAAGVEFVDGSILGSVTADGAGARLALSGPGAPRAEEVLARLGLNAKTVSSSVGDASMLKALRSVFMKGLEALSVECLVAANERGLAQSVLAALSDVNSRPIAETLSVLVGTHLQHAKRRHKEVQMVQRVLHDESRNYDMTAAAEAVFRRSAAANLGNKAGSGQGEHLEESLRRLAGLSGRESRDG